MKKLFFTLLFALSICCCFMVNASAEEWLWPVPANLHIYQPFKSTHSGLDISQNAYHIVYATKSGTVITSKPYVCTHWSKTSSGDHSSSCAWPSSNSLLTLGNYIEIDHGDGTISRYGHLCYGFNNSASGVTIPVVKVGDYVSQGTPIGIVGSSGNSGGQHLHFTIKKNGSNFNTNPANNSLITSNNSKYSNSDICNGGTINYVNTSSLYKKPGQTPSTPSDTEAPTNVKVSTYGTDVTVSWDGVSNATSYDVYLVQSPWGWSDIKYSKSVTGTSHKFTNIASGTYQAFVIARPNSSNNIQSKWVEFTVKPLPSAPSNVNVNVHGTDVTVTWNASANATSYDVYLIQSPWGWSDIKYSHSTTSTTYMFSDVTPGSYSAFVIARPNDNSVKSSWVSFVVNPLPTTPQNVKVSLSNTDVTVSWDASSYTTKYDVYLVQSPWNWSDIKYSFSTEETSHTFNNVISGHYAAFVIARPGNNSMQSEWSYFTICSSVPNAPVIKSDTIYADINSNVCVYWDTVADATSYSYYLTEFPEQYVYTTNISQGRITENKITFSNLTSGKYSVVVHANNNSGSSEPSNWVTFEIYSREYIPSKTIEFNGHIYAIYDYEMSWTFARDLCDYLGGHLVTITSEKENIAVNSLLQPGIKDAYWIGAYNTDESSKSFAWITNESTEYSNWHINEPSFSGDKGEKEYYVEIRKSYNNQWNDVKNTSKADKGFIIEIEPDDKHITHTETFRGNKYFLIDKNTTWLDAKLYCEMLGGHLITINTDGEQEFIDDFIKQGKRSWYYMGASGNNSKWTWIDGTDGQNIKWKDGVCAYDGYLMKYKTDNCTALNNSYYPASHIGYIGFICEIPVEDVEANVIRNKDLYTVNIDTYNIQGSYDVIVVGYKNNKFITYTTANDGVASLSGDIDEIKVMVWDSLSGLKPLCEAEVIPSSEFIVE